MLFLRHHNFSYKGLKIDRIIKVQVLGNEVYYHSMKHVSVSQQRNMKSYVNFQRKSENLKSECELYLILIINKRPVI